MSLIENLIGSVTDRDAKVRDIIAGRKWTLVASTGCGVSANMLHATGESPDVVADLRNKPLSDLLELALSSEPLQASIGVAALNSVLQGHLDPAAFKQRSIPRATDKSIVVVGDFPFVQDLRQLAREVVVLEDSKGRDPQPQGETEQIMHKADIAIITGSAIVTGTLEYLLEAARPCYTIVYGPSTPLSPILFEYGADQLVGITIKNEESAIRCVGRGTDDISQCDGVRSVVLGRNQQSR